MNSDQHDDVVAGAGEKRRRNAPIPGRTGRRPGPSAAREQILAAARERFAASGFEATSIRSIAADAKVDPSLVLHYFGSKEMMFRDALRLPFDPSEEIPPLLAGGDEGLGEQIARHFFGLWEDPETRPALLAITRSAVANEQAAHLLSDFLGREIYARIAEHVQLPDPMLRAELVAAQLIGAALCRYVTKIEPIASLSRDELAVWLGPTIDAYLTDSPARAAARAEIVQKKIGS